MAAQRLAEANEYDVVLVDIAPGARVVASLALELARDGYATGAAARNWESYGQEVTLPGDMAEWKKNLLCDPQTSGGLLFGVAREKLSALEARAKELDQPVWIIGEVNAGNGIRIG